MTTLNDILAAEARRTGHKQPPGGSVPVDPFAIIEATFPRPVPAPHVPAQARSYDGDTAYGRRALDDEVAAVASAVEGSRNHTLYTATANLCELVNGGELHEDGVATALHGAARDAGLADPEIRQTMQSARTRTQGKVRSAPPRQAQPAAPAVDPGTREELPPTGWEPVDLGPYLDGSYVPPVPSLLRRQDDRHLMYRGRVHWLSGEPEAGKTWLVLLACAQVIQAGGHVVYIDLEDGPGGMTSRLLDLGIAASVVQERFHYLNPPGALTLRARSELAPLVEAADLLVIDACTESLAQQGLSSKDDTDIATWLDLLPRWAGRLGPAVAVLDHVVKDSESRGRWATGSQHKLSGLDGVAFTLETVHPAGRGLTGRSRLYVSKDRHGQVRGPATVPSTGGRHWAGDLVIDSGDVLDVVLHAPSAQEGPFRPTVLMQRVSDALAGAGKPLSGREVEDRVQGRAQMVRQALAALVDDGNVTVETGAHNSKQHRLVRPYPDHAEAA